MSQRSLAERLQARWYSSEPAPWPLRPLSRLYASVAASRRRRLEAGRMPLACPVIVVGNISLGGTGKTPLVIWLVDLLCALGFSPGVISRGYGGRAPRYPFHVNTQPDPALAGDEPVLIASRTGVPVWVDPDRRAAARALLAGGGVDVIVSDDGLQHYRLPRALEFCVVDGARGLGNGWVLPAGPLREAPARLHEVDLVIANGGGFRAAETPTVDMHLRAEQAVPLSGGSPLPLEAFRGQAVHALAGIGNPGRFFDTLEARGITVHRHPFADHHAYRAHDLAFGDALPVLMTEKDAVKCRAFAAPGAYAVPVEAQIDPAGTALVRELLTRLRP